MTAALSNSRQRLRLLQKPSLWAGFDHYFSTNWQAKQIFIDLKGKRVDIDLVRECALWSFHPLGKNEGDQKRARGKNRDKLLRKALIGCESAIAAFTPYVNLRICAPNIAKVRERASDLIAINRYLAEQYREILSRQKENGTFVTKRLGVQWNCTYLVALKAHISVSTGWDDEQVLSAIVHLVHGVHKSLNQRPSPTLRSLLQKAIQHFEQSPQNARIIALVEHMAANPETMRRMFPPVSSLFPK